MNYSTSELMDVCYYTLKNNLSRELYDLKNDIKNRYEFKSHYASDKELEVFYCSSISVQSKLLKISMEHNAREENHINNMIKLEDFTREYRKAISNSKNCIVPSVAELSINNSNRSNGTIKNKQKIEPITLETEYKKLTVADCIGSNKETNVYNAFLRYGNNYIKYHSNCADDDNYYIASSLYMKCKELEEKLIKQHNGAYTESLFDAYKWTMALIKKVLGTLNYAHNGKYHDINTMNDICYLPHCSEVVEKNHLTIEKLRNTKKVDLMDLLKQWENRDGRTSQKKNVYFEGEEKTKDLIHNLKSSYGEPLTELISNCMNIKAVTEVNRIKSKARNMSRIIDILQFDLKDNTSNKALCDFKKVNKLEQLSRDDLKYLFC